MRLHKQGKSTQLPNLKLDVRTLKTSMRTVLSLLTEYGPEIGFQISEGYPVSYPGNAYSLSTYLIPEGWSMNIYFEDFDMEESKHCL